MMLFNNLVLKLEELLGVKKKLAVEENLEVIPGNNTCVVKHAQLTIVESYH
jgi:hypothetical protein